MAKHDRDLIAEIEREAIDEKASVSAALRKCVVLGGQSGSEALRDWATRELQGYYGVDELPDYRVIPAQIQIDGATMGGIVTGQPIARSSLPDFVQEKVEERVELRDGVGALEALIDRAERAGEAVKLSLPMGGDIARLMSADLHGQRILSIYWAVAPAALRSVIDQIRTGLTLLVAELRANTPRGETIPSADVANQAVNLLVTGKRHKITVTTAQTGSGGSASVSMPAPASDEESPFWTTSRRIGAIVVGLATIVGAVAAVLALSH